ncbi:oxygenase MpaB family protein [Nocardioides marmoribigeumensis]|uniref:ER-bound oxygenase mpaB/mpaB'/Rubber oxygenase catalytic domain-containing protein n=1 Tax=Nocardioides marmoribigeumensis TaxID=433649 RepID=A0ABU2BZP5_9ACTN|nr:oxygenase MpaB family protein [Nocardioides marmoribigeumensis]MDR7363877.1 hypothetical protein [Nocardioides marmoribigeumensis]
MTSRAHWLSRIAELDPVEDHEEIYRISFLHEFPWDLNQALSFALFRTYAVPSIGRLLFETGEFTERTQRRYDDTVLLLEDALVQGLGSEAGRVAVRRVNQMHAMYAISNDDMRYVLCTFVVVPIRWMDELAWRPFCEAEKVASAEYYRSLGRLMGIKGIPETWQDFAEAMDAYEARRFAYDEGARRVADATLDLLCTFPPNHLLPAAAVKRFSYALMDDALLEAFGYPHPSAAMRWAARAGLRARGLGLRLSRPRLEPFYAADLPQVRSHPDGHDAARLGTFEPPPGCPAHVLRGAPV